MSTFTIQGIGTENRNRPNETQDARSYDVQRWVLSLCARGEFSGESAAGEVCGFGRGTLLSGREDGTGEVVMNDCSEQDRALRCRFRKALALYARSTLWRETTGFP